MQNEQQTNEQQIAERLRQNIQSPTVPTTGTLVDEPSQPTAPDAPGYTNNIEDIVAAYKLYDYFGVQPQFRSHENEAKIQSIYNHVARAIGTTDIFEVRQYLLRLENQMGSNWSQGGNRLERIHQYIKLENQISRLKAEQDWL